MFQGFVFTQRLIFVLTYSLLSNIVQPLFSLCPTPFPLFIVVLLAVKGPRTVTKLLKTLLIQIIPSIWDDQLHNYFSGTGKCTPRRAVKSQQEDCTPGTYEVLFSSLIKHAIIFFYSYHITSMSALFH